MTNDTPVGFGNLWFSKRGTKGAVVAVVVLVGSIAVDRLHANIIGSQKNSRLFCCVSHISICG